MVARNWSESVMSVKSYTFGSLTALIAATALSCGAARAEPLFAFLSPTPSQQVDIAPQYAPLPADQDEANGPVDPRLQRQIVAYNTHEAPGTVVIDTPNTFLYYVLGNGQ